MRILLFSAILLFHCSAFAGYRGMKGNRLAKWAHTLFENKLEVYGIEALFKVKNPKRISKKIRNLWRTAAPVEHSVWSLAEIRWTKGWRSFFKIKTEVRVRGDLSRKMSERELTSLLKKTKPKTAQRAQLELRMALNLAADGKSKKAMVLINRLLAAPQGQVDKSLVALTGGRVAYAQGQWDKAADLYKKVSKGSEFWFTAQEEMAWAYMAKGETQNIMAVTNSLMPQEFASQVGPETVFLHAFSQLKNCDYFGAVKGLNLFRERFKKRSLALMQVRKKGPSKGISSLLQEINKGGGLLSMGTTALEIPRYVAQDQVFLRIVKGQNAFKRELAIAKSLRLAKKKSVIKSIRSRIKRIEKKGLALLKRRAKEELQEIKQVLQKMHILEAEWLQHVALLVEGRGVRVAQTETTAVANRTASDSVGPYDLTFPFTGEIWFDELNNYRPGTKRASTCRAGRVN